MPEDVAFIERLRGERFQPRPKHVRRAANFRDFTGSVAASEALRADLDEIIDCLTAGSILPPRLYRRGIERTYDELLDLHGIKHLHLGGGNSDVLLFLTEYDDRVVLLEVNSHRRLEDDPVGTALRSLHEAHLAQMDADVAAARTARVADRRNKIRKGLGLLKRGDD